MTGKFGPGCCCGPQGCEGDYIEEVDYDFSTDPFGDWVVTNPVFGVPVDVSVTGGKLRFFFDNFSSAPATGRVFMSTLHNQPAGTFESVEINLTLSTLETWSVPLAASPSLTSEGPPLIDLDIIFGRVGFGYRFGRNAVVAPPAPTRWWNDWEYGGGAEHWVGSGGGTIGVGEDSGNTTAAVNPFLASGDTIRVVATRIDGDTGHVELFVNGGSIGSQSGDWTQFGGFPQFPWDEAQCAMETSIGFTMRTPRFCTMTFEIDDLHCFYTVT